MRTSHARCLDRREQRSSDLLPRSDCYSLTGANAYCDQTVAPTCAWHFPTSRHFVELTQWRAAATTATGRAHQVGKTRPWTNAGFEARRKLGEINERVFERREH